MIGLIWGFSTAIGQDPAQVSPPEKADPVPAAESENPGKAAPEKKTSPPAGESSTTAPAGQAESKAGESPELTLLQQREMTAWAFVLENLPEMGEVLSRLKTNNATQYERVVTQFALTSERIARFKKTDPARAKLELSDWQIGAQIRLWAARSSLQPEREANFKDKVKTAIRQQQEVKIKVVERERDRLLAKAKEMEAQSQKQRENLDKFVENRWNEIDRQIKQARRALLAPPKPKSPAEKTAAKKTAPKKKEPAK